jgi:replicative DNA helicase
MPRADYEGRVLRTAILYPDTTLPVVLYALSEEDFTVPLYRQVFGIMQRLTQTKKPTSPAIIDALEEAHIPSSSILDSWQSTYSVSQIDDPIKEIKKRTQLVNLNKIMSQALEETKLADTKPDELVVKVMNQVHGIRVDNEDSSPQHGSEKMIQQWDKISKVGDNGIRIGLGDIDFATFGMRPQNLWLIGGYTSVGKSWVATKIANAHLEKGVPTLWLSYEMSAEELWWRTTVQRLNRPDITLDGLKYRSLSKERLEEYQAAFEIMRLEPFYTVDYVSDWNRSKHEIMYHIYARGIKCVIVDYVQNIMTDAKSEYEGMNTIIRDLQRIAVQKDVFVAAFSQMSRQSVQDNDDYVFGFKGSGNLENAADCAFTLKHGDPKNKKDPRRLLILGKNRQGQLATSHLWTNYTYGCLEEKTEQVWKAWSPSSNSSSTTPWK